MFSSKNALPRPNYFTSATQPKPIATAPPVQGVRESPFTIEMAGGRRRLPSAIAMSTTSSRIGQA